MVGSVSVEGSGPWPPIPQQVKPTGGVFAFDINGRIPRRVAEPSHVKKQDRDRVSGQE
jgi:hypothetical protein